MGLKKKLILSSKSRRRSLLRKRVRANQPPISSLPHDIIHKILLVAGEVPHEQFKMVKEAWHRFRDVMETDLYRRELDLWEMAAYGWPNPEYLQERELCLQQENPSALYLEGISCLFVQERVEEGLHLIRQASDKGYDLAIYANACLDRISLPRERWSGDITREFVAKARTKLSKDTLGPWPDVYLEWLKEMRARIDVASIEKCKCIPNINWLLPFKGPGACDVCFWKGESYTFLYKLITGVTYWPYVSV